MTENQINHRSMLRSTAIRELQWALNLAKRKLPVPGGKSAIELVHKNYCDAIDATDLTQAAALILDVTDIEVALSKLAEAA